jgi:hypothetical protein
VIVALPRLPVRRLALAALFTLAFTSITSGQTQIGGHYSALSLEYPDQTRHGGGAFFVYAPRGWIGVDVTTSWFPSDDVGGSAWQLLAGPRVGGSVGRIGIFGRVRPGLVRFSERFFAPETVCIAIFPTPEGCLVKSTNFALDYGTTVEASLSSRTVLRFDIGDALTRYRRGDDSSSWKHGLLVTAGAGWRF